MLQFSEKKINFPRKTHIRDKLIVCFAFLFLVIVSASAEQNWWQFRGPSGDGHTTSTNLPLKWSEAEYVTWKTAIHDRGWSSPVIWGRQIWLTTATVDGRKLFAVCLDKVTGKIVYDLHLFDVVKPMRITKDNTYATPTPVIDERRVILHFGTYGTACLDTETGDVLWKRRDLNCDHEAGAGPASSPTLVGDKVVVHVDGQDVQYIIALDKTTGKTVWKTLRSLEYSKFPVHHRKAYCMPALVPRGQGKQLVSPAGRGLYAYDPKTGKELWYVRHRGWSVAPRPVSGHGLVFATVDRDRPELWAIRLNGKGDVTDTHIVWRLRKGAPNKPSPVLHDGHLYTVTDGGVASCINPKTGEVIWQARIGGEYSASLLLSKGNIYCFDQDGTCLVFQANPKEFKQVSKSELDDGCMSSPAVFLNSLILRTKTHLYRIQKRVNK